MNLVPGANVVLDNITVNEYSGNFIEATGNTKLTMTSSQFYNLDLSQSTPFIKLSKLNEATSGVLFQNILFENVRVKHSLFLLEKSNSRAILFLNITMRNLTLKPIIKKESLDLQYENEWVGGICLLGRDSEFTLRNSLFENIYSHCIGLKSVVFTFENNTFTNAGLEDPPLKITDGSISERSGVSWLNLQSSILNALSYVTSCKFIENKIIPKYGGVSLS